MEPGKERTATEQTTGSETGEQTTNQQNPPLALSLKQSSAEKGMSNRRYRARVTFRPGLRHGVRKYNHFAHNLSKSSVVVDNDLYDTGQPSLVVRDYIGGYNARLSRLSGDFIYRRDPVRQALDECPRVSIAVVDKAISPVDIVTEFGKEEKKSLPAYYYSQSGRQPIKKKKEKSPTREKTNLSPLASAPVTPRFEPRHQVSAQSRLSFASPDKNFQIYFLPQKQNMLKFNVKEQDNLSTYSYPVQMQNFMVSRESTDLSREVSNMTLNSTQSDASLNLPGIIHDHPRSARSHNMSEGRGVRPETSPFRLPGRVATYN